MIRSAWKHDRSILRCCTTPRYWKAQFRTSAPQFCTSQISISVLSKDRPPKIDKRRCDVPAKLEKRGGADFRSPQRNHWKLTDPHGGDAWHPVPPTANKERLWNTEDLKCISKIFPACPVSGPRVANLLRLRPSLQPVLPRPLYHIERHATRSALYHEEFSSFSISCWTRASKHALMGR